MLYLKIENIMDKRVFFFFKPSDVADVWIYSIRFLDPNGDLQE